MENHQQQFLLALLAYGAQREIPLQQWCKLAGIEQDRIMKDPRIKLTFSQWNNLWTNAIHLSNDPLFGLHFGESLQLAALGAVGQLIQTSSTIGEAITHGAAVTRHITDIIRLSVDHSRQSFRVLLIPAVDKDKQQTPAFRQLIDTFMALIVRELDGLVLDRIKPTAVRYAYSPGNPDEYERVLRCRPVKGAGEYYADFDKKYRDTPILTANYELQELLLRKVQSTIAPLQEMTYAAEAVPAEAAHTETAPVENGVKKETPGRSGAAATLRIRVHNYLLSNAYLGIPSLQDLAANFHTSPRNLQRRLKEEGASYQDIADTVRQSLAVYYLESGNYRIKDISGMLGYNELSAFTRAFKRWTGASPVQFQKASA